MAASAPKRGPESDSLSRSLPVLGAPSLNEAQTAPMRAGASQPIRVAAAVLFMSFVFLPQTANQIRQRQNRPGVDGLGMAEVFAIAGFYATLADLLVYTLGLTSCFALVAVMHLAGNGLVFERGFRDVFDL